MDISATTSRPLQAILPDATASASGREVLVKACGAAPSAKVSSSPTSEPKSAAANTDTQVTLTANQLSQESSLEFSPVYAEIWKNGAKVAEIDIHGSVNPLSGLIASAQGTVGSSGTLLAARRATEIVAAVGGEIRIGGQVIDSKTLDMRAKLKIAYGI